MKQRAALTLGVTCALLLVVSGFALVSFAIAFRPPTAEEKVELTEVAKARYDAVNSSSSLRELRRIRIAANGRWASALTVTTGYSPILFFERAESEWLIDAESDGCLYPGELDIPSDIAWELGACKPEPSLPIQPAVICISRSSPVEQPVGFSSVRPSACNFHQRGRPAAYAYMVQMRHIHWLHWGQRVAVGKGQSPTNMVGLVNAKVRLSAPKMICGHSVFTHASFGFRSSGVSSGIELDRRFERC